jgi:cell division protein FtsL
MKKEPKDYLEEKPLQKVQDVVAENRIKWGVIAQGLILMMISAIGLMSFTFSGNVIDGITKINETLIEVRKEISNLNTGVSVNTTRIDNHQVQITKLERDVESNRDRITSHIRQENGQ